MPAARYTTTNNSSTTNASVPETHSLVSKVETEVDETLAGVLLPFKNSLNPMSCILESPACSPGV